MMFVTLLYEHVRVMLLGCLLSTTLIMTVGGAYYGVRVHQYRMTPTGTRPNGVRLP